MKKCEILLKNFNFECMFIFTRLVKHRILELVETLLFLEDSRVRQNLAVCCVNFDLIRCYYNFSSIFFKSRQFFNPAILASISSSSKVISSVGCTICGSF